MENFLRKLLSGGKFQGLTPARSRAMAAVRGQNNQTTERRLRFALVQAGIRGWQLYNQQVAGKPDFLFADHRLVVFVDGCFWHGCTQCGHIPKANSRFWAAKIQRNRERDRRTSARLREQGYRVLRFREHELREKLGSCVKRIRKIIRPKDR